MFNIKSIFYQISQKNLRSIFATMTTIGAVGASIGFSTPLISSMMIANNIPSNIIGYNGTIGGIATIIAASCASRIAMRFGVVKSMLAMLLSGSLSFLGFYIFQILWVWFILRFIFHFSISIMFILSEFWINSAAPPKKRGFILAAYTTIFGVGFSIGPILFSIVGSDGFMPFGIGFCITILASIPIIAAWNLSPKFNENKKFPFLNYLFKDPISTMAVFVFGAIQMGAITLITPFGLNSGYSEVEIAKFITLLALGSSLLLVPISIISDFLNNRNYALICCSIVGLAGALAIPFIINNDNFLKVDIFILGGISTGLYTISLTKIGENLKGYELASANSALIFCYGFGMLIGPAIIGQAMEFYPIFGFSSVIAAFFGLYIIIILIILLFIKNRSVLDK